ncbi:MAG TPA: hypothetical protein VNO70_20785 [Blastocatellia bacterium]|nr:hypothetical protein [Blastocatellia bacterium]
MDVRQNGGQRKEMPVRVITLFTDPTPNGYINLRYVTHMFGIAQNYTDLSDDEFKEFVKQLMFVGKKLVATWNHLNKYIQLETSLIEVEEKNQPIETLDFQHMSYSQDLFLELDEFLVQLKSALDYLAKLPRTIIGKKNWPDLRTFGDKGAAVVKALKNNVPKKWERQANMIIEIVFEKHRPWLEMAIAARDKINHFKDGGLDYEGFLVAKTTVNGEEKVIVPMWTDSLSVREYMQNTWHNLISLVEQFTIGFLCMRFKPDFGFVYIPKPHDSVASPIAVVPDDQVENVMNLMQALQVKSKFVENAGITKLTEDAT